MLQDKIARSVREQASFLEDNFLPQGEAIAAFALRVVETFNNGGRLLVFGSGALGAVSNLIANLFLHRLLLERPPLPALSLSQDLILATALCRDGQGSQLFARQLRVVVKEGDIVLALGDIRQDVAVEEGLAVARKLGCLTAALLQMKGNLPDANPDFLFHLETESAARSVEGALFFGHLLCEMVENQLFGI